MFNGKNMLISSQRRKGESKINHADRIIEIIETMASEEYQREMKKNKKSMAGKKIKLSIGGMDLNMKLNKLTTNLRDLSRRS